MRKSILTATALAALGFSTLAMAPSTHAAGATVTLTQSDFNSAMGAYGAPTNGISCNPYLNHCTLDNSTTTNYQLGENINLNEYRLYLDGNITLDLNNKELASNNISQTVFISNGDNNVLKNGTIKHANNSKPAFQAQGRSTVELTNINFTTTGGMVNLYATTATLNNVTASIIDMQNSSVIINSGTCSMGMLVSQDSELTINNGTFANPAGMALNISGDDTRVTINNGTFTGSAASSVLLEGGADMTINGGTFTGVNSGLFAWNYTGDLVLSGGTFRATDTTANSSAAIVIDNSTDESIANNLLAAGYRYTNPAVRVVNFPATSHDSLFIGGFETTVTSRAANTGGNTTTSNNSTTISAPKSGEMTREVSSATASLAPAVIIALGGVTAFALAKAKKED